ncbi:hypothetical protein GOBAR_DD10245 [Gossypium barbadense]|nr:hypothetical protein GOBAR_DD10245 [Gossypium barbadense]
MSRGWCLHQFVCNVSHVVAKCNTALEVWRSLDISWPTKVSNYAVQDWLMLKFANNNISIGIWAIWSSGSKLVHDGVPKDAQHIVTTVKSYERELECSKEKLPGTENQ